MHSILIMAKLLRLVTVGAVLLPFLAAVASAQSTGTITGRVFNPNTGEYVRNAQIRVVESGQSTISEGGGEYRLAARRWTGRRTRCGSRRQ